MRNITRRTTRHYINEQALWILGYAALIVAGLYKRENFSPGCMFANCGRARYNGLHMCKAKGRTCARQWLAHVQSNGVRMAMVHVNGAWARQSFCEAKIIKVCRSSKFQLMT